MKEVLRIFKVLLFLLLAPLFVPAYILMHFGWKFWSGLLGD